MIIIIKTTDQVSARNAIDAVSGALEKISFQRSTFGAHQNRLESALKINSNVSENTQASESLIRDTDMAKEMIQFSLQNVLSNAAQSMLSQANKSNADVLSLLA